MSCRWRAQISGTSTPLWSCSCVGRALGSTRTTAGNRRGPPPGRWCNPSPWRPGWWSGPRWIWGKRVCCSCWCRWKSRRRTVNGWGRRRRRRPAADRARLAWQSRCRYLRRCWRCRCTSHCLWVERSESPACRLAGRWRGQNSWRWFAGAVGKSRQWRGRGLLRLGTENSRLDPRERRPEGGKENRVKEFGQLDYTS